MGGIHVSSRGTYSERYIGVKSDLMLPSNISSDNRAGIKPEFILGMYSGDYGLDTGILYEGGQFKLFYWSLPGTCKKRGSDNDEFVPIPGVSVRDKITMKTFLNGNYITCQAQTLGGRVLATLNARLEDDVVDRFRRGSYINREIVIAANPDHVVNPCEIYFHNAEFYNGYVTDKSGNRHDLNNNISTITKDRSLDKTDSGRYNINASKIHTMWTDFGTDNGRSYEMATCDLSGR